MPKPKHLGGDLHANTTSPTPWSRTHGMYIAGRAYIDEADLTASEMESKWGAGRLRLLVGPELREKFDRQRYLFNQALWHGELEEVRLQAGRMVKAWLALDKAANADGKDWLSPKVVEVTLVDGTVALIAPESTAAATYPTRDDPRKLVVYTLDEIGRILSDYQLTNKTKAIFPGATVEAIRRTVSDPLDGIVDTQFGLEEEIPFE